MNTTTTVEIYRDNIYGNTLFYAKNNDWAKLYTKLTGDRSLTPKKMQTFTALTGIQFKEVLRF